MPEETIADIADIARDRGKRNTLVLYVPVDTAWGTRPMTAITAMTSDVGDSSSFQ